LGHARRRSRTRPRDESIRPTQENREGLTLGHPLELNRNLAGQATGVDDSSLAYTRPLCEDGLNRGIPGLDGDQSVLESNVQSLSGGGCATAQHYRDDPETQSYVRAHG
jgi:hypothetical protein